MHVVRSVAFHYLKKRQKLVADLLEFLFLCGRKFGKLAAWPIHASVLKDFVACCHSFFIYLSLIEHKYNILHILLV